MFTRLAHFAIRRRRPSPIVVIDGSADADAQWEPLNTPQASPPGLAPRPGRRTLWNVVSTPILPPFDVHELSHQLGPPREPSHGHGEIAPCRDLPRSRLLPSVHGWGFTATSAHASGASAVLMCDTVAYHTRRTYGQDDRICRRGASYHGVTDAR